jgi:hypothetical protein
MRYFWLPLCVLAASAAAETHTIRLKEYPDPKKPVEVREKLKSAGGVKVTDNAGKVVVDSTKNVEESEQEYTETVLEAGDKHPKKYRCVYRKAVKGEGKKPTAEPFEGRTVIFERDGDRYRVGAEGKPALEGEVLRRLSRAASLKLKYRTKDLVPDKAVTVGDTWKVSVKALAGVAGLGGGEKLDEAKSKATGKLVKVFRKDGAQWGVLEFRLEGAVTALDRVRFETPAKLDMTLTKEVPIDGSADVGKESGTIKLKGKGTLAAAGKKFTFEIGTSATGSTERSVK